MAEDGKNAAKMREYKFSNAKDGKHTKPVERLERVCGARCGKRSVGKECLGCNCNAMHYCSRTCHWVGRRAHWEDHREECSSSPSLRVLDLGGKASSKYIATHTKGYPRVAF